MNDLYTQKINELRAAGWSIDDGATDGFPYIWVNPIGGGGFTIVDAWNQYLLERDLAAFRARIQP